MNGVDRDRIERFVKLAIHLDDLSRGLVVDVYSNGVSIKEAALRRGLSKQTVARKLRRAWKRLNDPDYMLVAALIDHLPPSERELAEDTLLRGQSVRQTAELRGRTISYVRRVTERARIRLGAMRGDAGRSAPETGTRTLLL